ncbi:MAG: DUF4338 domain-containing protein [Pseudomonadota bacterium]
MNKTAHRYCGRDFTAEELETVGHIIADHPKHNRAHISRLVCQALGWYKPDGSLKDMSCRVALLRMQEDGLLTLPKPQHDQKIRRPRIPLTDATAPKPCIDAPVQALCDLHLDLVADSKDSNLWREYIHRYHYLGYTPLPGAQLRYTARANGDVVALLGFGAAAWTTAARDSFIGWTHEQRQKNLHLVVNNARFLVLPWIKSKNLASKLLSMAAKRLGDDWQTHYGYRPVLIETFVETGSFRGTCYKSANWICVGQTKGRGKLLNSPILPKKDIWLYPLTPAFRDALCCS